MEEAREKQRKHRKRHALIDRYPLLYGRNINPDAVYAGLQKAEDDGEPVLVHETTDVCPDDSHPKCATDVLRFWATPEGEIVSRRYHGAGG